MNKMKTLITLSALILSTQAFAAPGGDNAGVGPGKGDTVAGKGNAGYGVGVGSATGATTSEPNDTRTTGTSVQTADERKGKTTRTSKVGRKTVKKHTTESTINPNSADSQ